MDRLGLSEETFAHLCLKVDAILHDGAIVNLQVPYFAQRKTNGILEGVRKSGRQREEKGKVGKGSARKRRKKSFFIFGNQYLALNGFWKYLLW